MDELNTNTPTCCAEHMCPGVCPGQLQVWREQGVEGIQKLLGEGDACKQFKWLMGHCRDGCKAPAGNKGRCRVSTCTQLQELKACALTL